MSTIWHPVNFLNCDKIKNSRNYAIVVLNRPICAERALVESLWSHGRKRQEIHFGKIEFNFYLLASFMIAVDGGTNRWLSWLRKYKLEDKLKQPNLITGDLDSCDKESIAFFNKSRVVQTVDQDETDFTKSLRVLEPFINELKLENVIALCETSGRVDQILGNINSKS